MRVSRVLVVDDDTDIRATVVDILLAEGYEVDSAGSCEEALERLDARAPDVIVLDVQMEGADGADFARRYRERPRPHAPLVLFTALQDPGAIATKLGAVALLSKPFHVRELLDVVARHTARPEAGVEGRAL